MTTVARDRMSALAFSAALALTAIARPAAADTVVQVPVDSILDGRTVSTVAGGVVTLWTPGQGIDNDGKPDGYVTNAVETIVKAQHKDFAGCTGKALPDDGVFPMTARHPEIALHFSNTAPTTRPQTHSIHANTGAQTFEFPVPSATYSKMYLVLTSSEGKAALTITLSYAAGAPSTTVTTQVPDYGQGGAAANDAQYFNLIQGMCKWKTDDTEIDGPSHTLTAIELTPTATAMLTSIKVAKTGGAYVVFWGATGVATSPVTVGAGGSGGSGSDGGVDGASGSGSGGAGGAAGASGAGGGAAGTSGAGGGGAAGTSGAGGGGATGTGGASAGGTSGTPGTGGAGGASAGGGAAGTTASSGAAGSSTSGARSNGSGCSLAAARSPDAAGWTALVVGLAMLLRTRRRARGAERLARARAVLFVRKP